MSKSNPEEQIRLQLMAWMVRERGYPKGLIAKEGQVGCGRRFDLVCYHKQGGALTPLLLIECKAGLLNKDAENQLLGYNEKIQAPFIALANGRQIETIWYEGSVRRSVPFLPSYTELLQKI